MKAMKKRLILFACIAGFVLLCASLSACGENEQVIAILKAPSELDFLNVIAYTGEYQIPGGASMEPAFRKDGFDYTVYVAKDTTHISVDAGLDDEGTVTVYSENDQITGDADTRFDLLGDEVQLAVTAQAKYMEKAEYRITVKRGDPVPTARDVIISVEPGIAAFFIGSGVTPLIKVTAVPPGAGVVLNYQWYVNDENNTRTGSQITNANEDNYRMQAIETMVERDVYYYVEITTVMDGRTGITQSAPRRVTFVNKGALNYEKSLAMADIPAGTVADKHITGNHYHDYHDPNGNSLTYWKPLPWSTPGFRMGRNLVTWELWETIFNHAERGNYKFQSIGNQGATTLDASFPSRPVGNKLHPVTKISWRDAVVWCNAYSEMDGLEPVYRDKDSGEPLRDSREAVDRLYDVDIITDYNGYRLPTREEWIYAAHGANPDGNRWEKLWPGINTNENDNNVMLLYLWSFPRPEHEGLQTTGEVGNVLPNQLWDGSKYIDGLYDLFGMLSQWVDNPSERQSNPMTYSLGDPFYNVNIQPNAYETYLFTVSDARYLVGLRLTQSK